uniref:Uncharacterized protein n=1 Tax=Globisporangium ultimum (strain ATCC 200006 / CBS 805.95 / DAOM BR144) TaxID=431595 RepID=K3X4H2_GLOUD
MFEYLAAKADSEITQSLQTKKLDVSVYESAVWDVKKYRAALEQNMHDLFAAFAHQIEAQVNSKVSIEDFNLIFNPEANGQKQAIENAATRISRMKDQLESLQEYVNADRQRQHKIADLNVGMLDLTRKHNASRNALAQLMSSVDTTKQEITELETSRDRFASEVAAITEELQTFKTHIGTDRESKEEKQAKIMHDVHELQSMSSKMAQSLEQIQQFTRDTLLKTMDTKLKQLSNNFHRGLDDLSASQRQYAQLVTAQLEKSNAKQQYQMEQMSLLESRIRKLGAHLRDVSDQLNLVKGPLATLATNLREENVTILQEIQRSQNESRDIMLDYQELLEKEQLPTSAIPSRPSSSSSAFNGKEYASTANLKRNCEDVYPDEIGTVAKQ